MTNREIAKAYLSCFCNGDIDGLTALLAPDLYFFGSLHEFHSADEYLASLRADPPARSDCKILSLTESVDTVAVFYEYQKPGKALTIAQLFEMKQQRIRKILLVFDPSNFA